VIEACQLESQWELTWDHRPTPAPTSFVVPTDSRLVTCVRQNLAREQNQPIKLVLGRSVADTNHFAVYGGVPTLICGPQGGNTCEANEYLDLPSLLPTARAITASVVDLLSA
jgi:acetylornithine deacetylase/succinyl-diaminopimelate desuccinylase-like protein